MIKEAKAHANVMWWAARTSIQEAAVDAFVIFTLIIQPLIVALIGLWVLRDTKPNAAIYVVVGSGMSGLWSSMIYISGQAITRERWTGTLETVVAMPTPLWVVVTGRNLAHVTQSLLSMITSYLVASLFMGYALSITQPGFFVISLVLIVLSFVAFGLIIAPIFLLSPVVQSFTNGMEFPIYVLSGFLFPIALLPGWTTPLSYLLTPYWAARALHASAHGRNNTNEILFCWALMLISAAFYLLISQRLFQTILRRVRENGTLGLA